MPTPTQQITAEVLTWPGTRVRIGARDEYGFVRAGRELGHLHGDRVAHFGFPRDIGAALREAGRVGPHPVNPHSPKLAARRIEDAADVAQVLSLLRLNYDRSDRHAEDEVEIRALAAQLDASQSDPERFAALLTADVSIVNIAGVRIVGREAMREAMAHALAGELAHVTTHTEVVSVAFPGEDVAVVSMVKRVHDGRESGAELPLQGAYTLTVVRTPDGWRVAAAQTTPLRA